MSLFTHQPQVHDHEAYQALTRWYQGSLGQHLLQREQALVNDVLSRRFGHHLLQLGCGELWLHGQSTIAHKFAFAPFPQAAGHQAIADAEAIPLATASVDCILLHHALDYALDQHQLLREVSRVLIAGGYVVIVGFNPISSWGLRGKLTPGKRSAPFHARMLRCLRVCDWLKLLDFRIDDVRYAEYALPIDSPAAIRYSGWMESLASRLNWPSGGVYVITAHKQVLPLIPVNGRRRRMSVPALGIPIAGGGTGRSSALHSVDKEVACSE
ncbi:MAG TPA: class I SAM-dependent methyltransferase [Candidatus Acidoferrum sp.]|nr:class I SAM-dependent methyltransferase [Candidatus Acidoferrum sp.]